ncbi:MAG: RES family NAD+ phosphorylase [Terriglobales bacterium]
MKLPPATRLRRNDTHRLIPSRYVEGGASVLARISRDPDDLEAIYELDSATNARLVAQTHGLPGISRELVFGVPYAPIINGCYAHPHPLGSRFNGADRGAWYAAFALRTSELEVAYHRRKELEEIGWQKMEVATYVDFLADFNAEFHDLRGQPRWRKCLDPNSYQASQQLARTLLNSGALGVIYPSVRHKAGTCLVCFRPLLVGNVRRGTEVTLTFVRARLKAAERN